VCTPYTTTPTWDSPLDSRMKAQKSRLTHLSANMSARLLSCEREKSL
jgi:hypothetical protein